MQVSLNVRHHKDSARGYAVTQCTLGARIDYPTLTIQKHRENALHLRTLTIKNFRALDDITVDFTTRVSVIVGPNAAGKTTVIEAARLAKALLAVKSRLVINPLYEQIGLIGLPLFERLDG